MCGLVAREMPDLRSILKGWFGKRQERNSDPCKVAERMGHVVSNTCSVEMERGR